MGRITPTVTARHQTFRELHLSGCFVLPNPWNPGSARWLEHAGFEALATTSAGYAFSRGVPDRKVAVDDMLQYCREIVATTSLPINVDFEDGYANSLDGIRANVRRCVETGVSALSIEDSMADNTRLYAFDDAVARMRAAREAIDSVDKDVMLVGRAECYLVGQPNLDETIHRLVAYAEVGADCLYAPGISTHGDIEAIVKAVAPKPVNVMMEPAAKLGLKALTDLGVRRVSTGSALALAAWTGLVGATNKLLHGEIDGFANTVSYWQLGKLFAGFDDVR